MTIFKKINEDLARASNIKGSWLEAYQLYDDILTKIINDTDLYAYFEGDRLANIFWDRSVTCAYLADDFYNLYDYQAAIGWTRRAQSDVRNAQVNYTSKRKKLDCDIKNEEYIKMRETIIEAKEAQDLKNQVEEQAYSSSSFAP